LQRAVRGVERGLHSLAPAVDGKQVGFATQVWTKERLDDDGCDVRHEVTIGALLAEILDYPGVPAQLRRPNPALALVPVVSLCFQHEGSQYDFFSTVTTLGTPQDVTLEELRIECFFPANPATERQARALLGAC
jgi:hypothetical protein